ncbi:hypothetical protein C8R47DRAFT_1064303 [Mycena vitilis]|nr:hypothetical protein C8R47DRAFT_1064303 [Mycena vitilis]
MAKGKKRERTRIPKEARKNLRLWAEGARESILTPHIDGYAAALTQGWQQERRYLKGVCKEYHARVSWRVPDHEEPELKDWNPTALIPTEILTDEEQVAKRQRVKSMNARIRRWFKYRIRRIRKHRVSAGLDPAKDPFAVCSPNCPARQAFQQFMRESYQDSIAPVVAERWAREREDHSLAAERTKEPKAGFRAQIAREMFSELPISEQKALGERAKKEAQEAKDKYTAALNAPPSEDPVARQSITTITGMHATLIVGGPVPLWVESSLFVWTQQDRAGATLGSVDKPRFAQHVQAFMIEYLKTAFMKAADDCAQAALLPTGRTVPDLSGAKYTIDGKPGEDSDSDSDTDSDDSSDSESDLGTDDEEERARTRKKTQARGAGAKHS